MCSNKASTTTMWRLVDERIDAAHLPGGVRRPGSGAGSGLGRRGRPPAGRPLYIDLDATLVIDHSDNKQDAAPTWKKSFGHHPLLAFLDRPEIAGGEALAGRCCAEATPARTPPPTTSACWSSPDLAARRVGARPAQPGPTHRGGALQTSAGSHPRLATARRDGGVGFSFGFAVDHRRSRRRGHLNPAMAGTRRRRGRRPGDGAWVAEATSLVVLGLARRNPVDPA